ALAWHWARQLWGLRAGRSAAAMLSVATGWYLFSHQLLIDLLLSVLYLLSLYLLWRAVLRPKSRGRWAAFYAAAGLMVMAKGLIGLFFPLAALLVFALWHRERRLLQQCRPLLGLLILIALCVPWAAAVERRNPGALRYWLENEHLKRIMDVREPADYSVVKISPWGYLLITAVWMMPWSLLAWQAACFSRKEAAGPVALQPRRDAVVLLAIGALLPVVAFLPMPARLIYYGLPAAGPFTLLAAGWWARLKRAEASPGRLLAGVSFMLCGAACASAAFWAPALLQSSPQLAGVPEMPQFAERLALLLGSALLLGGLLLLVRRAGLALAALFVLLSGVNIYNVGGFRLCAEVCSSARLVERLRGAAGTDCVWISEGSRELGASAGIGFYLKEDSQGNARTVRVMEDGLNRPPPRFPTPQPYLLNREGLAKLWNSGQPALFVTDVYRTDWKKDPPALPEGERHEVEPGWHGQRKVYANKQAWERIQR
ncbi:MAG: glycosyltransferase family 39 protein, partial [Planctomycetota bacterium]